MGEFKENEMDTTKEMLRVRLIVPRPGPFSQVTSWDIASLLLLDSSEIRQGAIISDGFNPLSGFAERIIKFAEQAGLFLSSWETVYDVSYIVTLDRLTKSEWRKRGMTVRIEDD